jgi:hypothetical protein
VDSDVARHHRHVEVVSPLSLDIHVAAKCLDREDGGGQGYGLWVKGHFRLPQFNRLDKKSDFISRAG